MKPTELAYIAGIVDGEGNIAISKRRPRRGEINFIYRDYVKISNTDKRMLEWIKAKVKLGTVLKDKYRKNRPNSRHLFVWHITNRHCLVFLRAIYPYLVIKKEQADVIFKLRSTFDEHRAFKRGTPDWALKIREGCFERLKFLHHQKFE